MTRRTSRKASLVQISFSNCSNFILAGRCVLDHSHSFEVATSDATYYMFADSEKEKDDWIGAIGHAIVKYSGAFISEGQGGGDDDDSDSDSEDDDPYKD